MRAAGVVRFVTVAAACIACGGVAHDDDARDGGAEASPRLPAADCSLLAELRSSPRANAEAEQLAFRASGTLTAPTDAYLRIASDLAAIRATFPEVASIVARRRWTNDVRMGVDDVGFAAMNAGTYHAWDCLNSRFGSTGWSGEASSFTKTNSVAIRFGDRRLNPAVIIAAYSSLPNRTWIGGFKMIGDGSDVCAARSGDQYTYAFKLGGGDCPSGCTEETYWGFVTTPEAAPVLFGKSGPDSPPPQWLAALPTCKDL